MKKSLAITTIATILVIVVALTTATFAWFSSSNETKVSGDFTAQASNSVFTFYPFMSNTGANESYDYKNGSSLLDLGLATDVSDVEGKFGVFNVETMGAYMPAELIDATNPVSLPKGDNWSGLPGAKFYTATQEGSQLINAYYSATKYSEYADGGMPNVARFELYNSKASAHKLKITVKITGKGNPSDLAYANALRFVMIGKPYKENNGKAFIVGTPYKYGGIPRGTDLSTTHTFTPEAYKEVKEADYADFASTGYVNFNNYELKNLGVDTQGTITYEFNADYADADLKVDANKSYEVYLYVWLDGELADEGLGGGKLAFSINFEGEAIE